MRILVNCPLAIPTTPNTMQRRFRGIKGLDIQTFFTTLAVMLHALQLQNVGVHDKTFHPNLRLMAPGHDKGGPFKGGRFMNRPYETNHPSPVFVLFTLHPCLSPFDLAQGAAFHLFYNRSNALALSAP